MLPYPYNRWPYSETQRSNLCEVCGAQVLDTGVKFDYNDRELIRFLPSSLYWSDEKKVVYCGAEHSLRHYDETKQS
jgi:hypothetical protein